MPLVNEWSPTTSLGIALILTVTVNEHSHCPYY